MTNPESHEERTPDRVDDDEVLAPATPGAEALPSEDVEAAGDDD